MLFFYMKKMFAWHGKIPENCTGASVVVHLSRLAYDCSTQSYPTSLFIHRLQSSKSPCAVQVSAPPTMENKKSEKKKDKKKSNDTLHLPTIAVGHPAA